MSLFMWIRKLLPRKEATTFIVLVVILALGTVGLLMHQKQILLDRIYETIQHEGDSGLFLDLGVFRGNVERYATCDQIFYNRVPKCGSTTASSLFRKTSKQGRYNYPRETAHAFHFHYNNTKQVADFVTYFDSLSKPLFFSVHLHYVDFDRYNSSSPVYINLVRDPIDRLVSWYYFIRFAKGHIRDMSEKTRNMTFDDCVHGRHSECADDEHLFIITPFFCGHSPQCRQPTRWALETAKANIRKHFAVVGILEDVKKFYIVAEAMFPHYFKGLGNHFIKEAGKKDHGAKMVNLHKEPISTYSRTILMETKAVKMEYKLYNFIKNYFATTIDALEHIREAPDRA